MKITTITYRRTKNLWNYESEVLEMTAEVEYDDPAHAFRALKKTVLDLLNVKASHEENLRQIE